MKEKLINCKKCGVLFIKNTRDICSVCNKEEVELIDKIKEFISACKKQGKKIVPVAEVLNITQIPEQEFENLFERGRLFSVMNHITLKCKLCGAEFQCAQKAGLICPKCVAKFSQKERGKINAKSDEAKKGEVEVKKAISKGDASRFGYIEKGG